MRRRTFLATVGTGVAASTAGCGMLRSSQTLMEPTVNDDGSGRGSLVFTDDGGEVGSFGVDGGVDDGTVHLRTEISHREETEVTGVTLRVWRPAVDDDNATQVALLSPVEGDSSPPPSVTLATPDRGRGTVISLDDLDDLRDETISTIELLVRPRFGDATTVAIDATIELSETGVMGDDYTLEGRLELDFPTLTSD